MKTKIVITLGPSTSEEGLIQQATSNGVSALRINTAHGSPDAWLNLIRKARKACKAPIIIDLVGHSIRYKGVDLGIKKGVSVTIKDSDLNTKISSKLKKGQRLIINEGQINAIITSANNSEFTFKTRTDGALTKNNKLTIPGLNIKINILNNNTREAIKIVNDEKIEFVALSFTQDANDLKNLKKLVPDSLVIAKIENEQGVRKHEEIISESDAIIIGRGDLGAELKISHVPMIQKELIKACNKLAKPVIVATQILESMINTPYPTRAEASDIANAILDGADALMLSGETTIGKYPLECVKVINEVSEVTENRQRTAITTNGSHNISDAITQSVVELSYKLKIDKVITITRSGYTARMISRLKPKAEIIAFSNNPKTINSLSLSHGVNAHLINKQELSINECASELNKHNLVTKKDLVIFAGGFNVEKTGVTNMIQINTGETIIDGNL